MPSWHEEANGHAVDTMVLAFRGARIGAPAAALLFFDFFRNVPQVGEFRAPIITAPSYPIVMRGRNASMPQKRRFQRGQHR
jgi:hypothetical protein